MLSVLNFIQDITLLTTEVGGISVSLKNVVVNALLLRFFDVHYAGKFG